MSTTASPGPGSAVAPTTAPPTADPAGPGPASLPTAGLLVLLAALFVVTLDFFIVNVAVPDMRRDLGAGTGATTLWVAGFAIAFGAFIVLGSRLGDRLGRRRVFVLGLAVFTVASAACGVAPDPTTLALGRVAQGLGAALVSPQVLATVTATTDGEARVRALTAYG
ncbi:MAG: MFS transporter, partial [Actinobacteria bacterium]|nr:MFS transporter [Actinomycetota bacterium]